MKKDYTHISFLLDNSGSMLPATKDTIGGFNTFLEKQKSDPGTMTFSLYEFLPNETNGVDNPLYKPEPPFNIANQWIINPLVGHYVGYKGNPSKLASKIVYDFTDIQEVAPLDNHNYICHSGTPLLDTIGFAVYDTGVKLAKLPESLRPDVVIFVILTDGEERHSRAYTLTEVHSIIKHQTEAYNWQFMFLGANQDAIQTGASFGIASGSSLNFAATDDGIARTYNVVADNITARKFMKTASAYTDDQRASAMGGG